MRGFRSLPGLAVILFLFTGCAGLYNQQHHDSAVSAQKSFTEAKLAESIKDERAQNAEILARELDIVEQQMVATRNKELLDVIGSKDAGEAHKLLADLVDARMGELASKPTQTQGPPLIATIGVAEEAREAHSDRYSVFREPEDPALVCTDDTTVKVSVTGKPEWDAFQTDCKNLAEANKKLEAFQAGILYTLTHDLTRNEEARAVVTKEVKRLTTESAAAAKKLKEARNAGTPADLAKLAEKSRDDLRKVKIDPQRVSRAGLEDASVLATLESINEQKANIDLLLDAAATGKASDDADDAAAIAAILPAIAKDVTTATRYPQVSRLVLESERLRIDRDRAKQQLSRVAEEMRLLRMRRDILYQEWLALVKAQSNLAECKPDDFAGGKNLRNLRVECRDGLSTAVLSYAAAWTLGRIPAEKVQWTLINLDYERALDASESALMQWNNLIAVPLDALVANYGSGIKPDAIGKAISGIELGAIALGVQ